MPAQSFQAWRLVAEHLVTVYETMDRPLVPVLRAMEAEGIAVDRDELRRLSNDFATRLVELEKQIYKAAGHEFDVRLALAARQDSVRAMGLAAPSAAPSRPRPRTALIANPAPTCSRSWRAPATRCRARCSTGADLEAEDRPTPTHCIDRSTRAHGRVHPRTQWRCRPGRLSIDNTRPCKHPTAHQQEAQIRKAFVAAKGCELLSFDYSQIELRIVAHVADIGALKQAFRDGQGHPRDDRLAGLRRAGRRHGQARARPRQGDQFRHHLWHQRLRPRQTSSDPQGEARAYIDAYFKKYPGIRAYMDRTKDLARQHAYVTTLFGRRVHVPGITAKNPAQRSFAERAAINAPIQGAAADIIKRAMVKIPAAIAKAGLKAKMLLQVHDELLFEAPPAEREKTIAVVKPIMENAAKPVVDLSVPLVVEAGHGATWDDAH